MENVDRQIVIIIPVYNCKKYLMDAVTSVSKQTCNKIKVVLVDDGSTDGSSKLCDSLANKYDNIFVIHQKNAGVSAARNAGIEWALSVYKNHVDISYIAFLDADDAWAVNFFETDVYSDMIQGYDLIGFLSCDCNSTMTKRNEPRQLIEAEYQGGTSAVWIHASQHFGAMLYSCKFLLKYNLRFNKNLKYTEDKLFSMSALYLADNILLRNKLMYLYRQNDMSAIHTRPYGIPYFRHIIHAYLMLDRDMSTFYNSQRGELMEGRKLVSIYVMDMADEHFSHFGIMKDFERFLQNSEDGNELIALLNGENSVVPVNTAYQQMCHHPVKYVFVRYLKGIIVLFLNLLKKVPFVRKLREAKSFPIIINKNTIGE